MANPNPSPETRFRPGGPPGPGRPRSKPLTDRLRERLEEIAQGGDGRALADELVDRWIEMIRAGDGSALRELLTRVEGKVSDRVEHEGAVTIRVEYAEADGPDPHDHSAEAASEPG